MNLIPDLPFIQFPAKFSCIDDMLSIGFGKVMMPLRLALVGELKGPDMFDIMFMIGKPETIKRIEKAVNTIKN